MARLLAVSSQVARGHVGLSAMVPALQALGHDVTALPTILLSCHPGHPQAAGERVAPALLARMLDALDSNGWLAEVDAVLTGYMPSPEHAAVAADAVRRVRSRAPRVLVLVDAVLGDEPKGLYIAPEAAAAVRDLLVPLADIVKGNAFEAGWLAESRGPPGGAATGPPSVPATDAAGQRAATGVPDACSLGVPALVVTSHRAPGQLQQLANVLSISGGAGAEAAVAQRAGVPKGTGDLLAALLAGHLLHESGRGRAGAAATEALRLAFARAVGDVDCVVELSLGRPELDLVSALPGIAARRSGNSG